MRGCRHTVLSLPQQVEAEGLFLQDHALRQRYPINKTAAGVLAQVDGKRSVEDIAARLADDGESEELIDPILGFAGVLNQAYLLNASHPWSWREAICRLQELWIQLIFFRRLPVPDGSTRVDLTAQQQRSTLAGALRVARFSLGKMRTMLTVGAACVIALAFSTGSGFDPLMGILLAALCGAIVSCFVLHELGHYLAFAYFEAPPRRLFLKSSIGTCGLSHAALPRRFESIVTTAAGPFLPLAAAGVVMLLTPLPGEIRLVSSAVVVSQVIGLTALASDGRRLVSLLLNTHQGSERKVSVNLYVLAATTFAFLTGAAVGLVGAVSALFGLTVLANASGWQPVDFSLWRIVFFTLERSSHGSSSSIGPGILLVAAVVGAINVVVSCRIRRAGPAANT